MNDFGFHQWQALCPGTVVSSGRGPYRHAGMLTESVPLRERFVLSLTPDGPVEEPLSVFARGEPVRVEGYPGRLKPEAVLWRARNGRIPEYSWTSANCEHFVRAAHGVKVESPQVQGWTLLGAIVALLMLGSRT